MNLLCIYNPQAGGGKSVRHLGEIKRLFEKHHLTVEFLFTEHAQHASELVQSTDLLLYDGLIIAGGDGSFFNALNGYMKKPQNERIPMGILPLGTGNSLSRDIILEEKAQIEDFIKVIKKKKTKLFDIAKVVTKGETFYYSNMMGFGFINDVVETASKLKAFKSFAYTLGVLYNTAKLNTFDLQISIDGEEHTMDNVFVIISNSRYTGGNYLIAPKAEINDGKLDLIILNKLSRINLLKTFPKIFDGSHINTPFVDYIHAKKIILKAKVPKTLSPDGEVYGNFPAEISCLPKAIELFS